MNRLAIAAAVAASLVLPAGASAQDEVDVTDACFATIQACVHIPTEAIDTGDQCTTPVMPCVQQAVNGTFATADRAIATAKWGAYTAIDAVDDPPPLHDVCYAIWGQSCASALVQ
jgi:hypothetical protein